MVNPVTNPASVPVPASEGKPPPDKTGEPSAWEQVRDSSLWDEDGLSFGDVLDMINPLQHLPVVSDMYRQSTGDGIGHLPRLVGGALFGGLLGSALSGVISSAVNVLVKAGSARDVGEHVLSWIVPPEQPAVSTGETNPAAETPGAARAAPGPTAANVWSGRTLQEAIDRYESVGWLEKPGRSGFGTRA